MKRLQYHRYGGPEEIHLEDFTPSDPGEGQIVVRVKAASVNPIDWKTRAGIVKFITGEDFPRAMGTDFAGVVEKVGSGVTRFRPGDAVCGTTDLKDAGTFAEVVLAYEGRTVSKPSSLSFEEAAALPVVFDTAWSALVATAGVTEGQSVFVHGCLGGVGRAGVQIAKLFGAHVTGSCRGAAAAQAVELGVDPVLDFEHLDIESLKQSFDLVFDTAGTLSVEDGNALAKPSGMIIDIAPDLHKMETAKTSPHRKIVMASHDSVEHLTRIVELAEAGKLTPFVGKTVSLFEAIPALTALERTGTPKGKLVIVPEVK